MKLVKSNNGNYSVKYRDATGSTRSTFLKTKDRNEALKLVKDLKIEELESAGKLGILSADVIAKISGGSTRKYWDVVLEYKEHMSLSANSENSIYTMMKIYEQFGKDYGYIDKPMATVSEKDLYNFLNCPDGTSLNMRALRKSSLNQLFNFAQIKLYTLTNPLLFIKIDKSKLSHKQKTVVEREVFTKGEVNKIIKHAPYFFKQATALSYWTGLRLGDICSLEWASIEDRDRIIVWTEKRDKLVSIDTMDPLFGGGILKDVMKEIDVTHPTFCFPEWQEIISKPKSRSKPSVYFKRLCERLQIYGRSFHCLRHSCITRLDKAGLTLEEIGKVVGHSDSKTTEGYVHK